MASATKTYDVVQNLRHNGKGFRPDSTVDLNDKEAKPLIDSGVVRVPAAKEAKEK